jgi:hypothetical protein
MKIDIEQIESTLLERKIDPTKVNDIIKDLIQSAEEEKADNKANADPKQKWEHIVILNDLNNEFKDKEVTAWVVQQRVGQDASLIIGKLQDGAKAQNETSKRKKTLLKSFVDIFEALKPAFIVKEKGVRIKTKEAVRVICINGNSM